MTDSYRLTDEEEKRVLEFRRDLHMHPELSHCEFRTTEKIRAFLETVPGIAFVDIPVKTGLLARMVFGKPGPEVGLRADIDAIRQTETYENPWKSTEQGIMHACGHDFHTAALLGAALILSRNRADLCGSADLLFQEAEETTDGAQEMLAAGLLERIHPSAFFALHNRPEVETGKVVVKNGALMAAKTNFLIRIRGVGGHGSMPHLCVDPIVCAAALIQSLQTVVSRNTDPLESVVLSVGSIHGGSLENLVVDRVEMTASIRSLSMQAKEKAVRRMECLTKEICAAYECGCEIEYRENLPLAFNGPEMYAVARKAAEAAVGPERVTDVPPTLASEDFSMIMAKVPSFLYWVGSGTAGEPCHAWHSADFHANEKGVRVGAELLVQSVMAVS